MAALADSDIKKQTPRNLIGNGLTFVTTAAVGVWLVPYLRGRLGVAGYGLIPLALGVISYIAILVQSLARSIGRFLTIDLQRRDDASAVRTFNTSFRLLLLVCLVHIPFLGLCAWLAVRYLDIPADLVADAFRLFLLTFASFFTSVFSAVYYTTLDAHNRLDLKRLIEVSRLLVRAGLIVALFSWLGPSLTRVGIASLAASVVELLLSMFFCRRITPQLVVVRGVYDPERGRELFGLGKWIIIHSAGFMLLMKVDLVIVNLIGGAVASGDYAPCLLVNEVLRSVAGVMSGVIWPVIMLTYARAQWERLGRVLHLSVRGLGAVIAIPVGIACGMAVPFLSLWIGETYTVHSGLFVILLFHLPLNLAVLPLYTVHTAYNRVKVPALYICVVAVFHVALAWLLAHSRLGVMFGVAAASVVTWTLKDAVFVTLYATHVMRRPWYSYAGDMLRIAVFLLVVAATSYIVQIWLPISSWVRLLVACATLAVLALPIAWRFLLAPNERTLCVEMIRAQLRGAASAKDKDPSETEQ